MHKSHLLLTESIYDYLLTMSVHETPEQIELRQKTIAGIPHFEMMTSPDQARFLAFLIKLMNARKVIEVGVFTGYATLAMALALPAEGSLIACDVNSQWTDLGRPFWKRAQVEHKIQLKIAPALETLQDLLVSGQQGTFDFIFIDADKINYPHYYECALQLLRVGGLVVIDNVLLIGEHLVLEQKSPGAKIIHTLNQRLFQDKRVNACMISMGGGMTLAQKIL